MPHRRRHPPQRHHLHQLACGSTVLEACLPADVAELAGVKVAERLGNLGRAVHHERPAHHDGLAVSRPGEVIQRACAHAVADGDARVGELLDDLGAERFESVEEFRQV
jgi:hypothetical protein